MDNFNNGFNQNQQFNNNYNNGFNQNQQFNNGNGFNQNQQFNQQPKKSWYEQTWAIVLLLIFFFPVGLFLMWKYSNWKKPVKIIITVIFALIIVGNIGSKTSDTNSKTSSNSSVVDNKEKSKEDKEDTQEVQSEDQEEQQNQSEVQEEQDQFEEVSIPTEYKSALIKAKSYSDLMHMSKQGIYDQLTSEYGEKFSAEAAQYAIDNVNVDWNANALEKAKSYQETMAMSPSAIYDQLTSEYGEKFTPEEAQYAIDNLN